MGDFTNNETHQYYFEILTPEKIYIREEGKTQANAELKVFARYLAHKNCEHEYLRVGRTERGICLKCNTLKNNHFPPLKTCACCSKRKVGFSYKNKNLCLKHFIETVNKDDLNHEKKTEIESDIIFDALVQIMIYEILKNHQVIGDDLPEYKISQRILSSYFDFYTDMNLWVKQQLHQKKQYYNEMELENILYNFKLHFIKNKENLKNWGIIFLSRKNIIHIDNKTLADTEDQFNYKIKEYLSIHL